MGCTSCGTKSDGKPQGCRSNGSCSTGGCNKMNTYDWLSMESISDPDPFRIVEISFKNGARKDFYFNPPYLDAVTGDMVAVESDIGYNVGVISLSGELTRLQMRKKKVRENGKFPKILRIANDDDLNALDKARSQERDTMIKARVIARSLDLKMKIGDVEYQADRKKATFYYIADGRVDFRELIRHYARDFRVKVDMRQIGARQESGLIGGLGSCGRELCCSTWLSNFDSVSTSAARYQNLSINQVKLSGQCGRLKCCLNYELDTYLDALQKFPKNANSLKTEAGIARLIKKDIFKGIMYYSYNNDGFRSKLYALKIEAVNEIMNRAKADKPVQELKEFDFYIEEEKDKIIHDYENMTGIIELPAEQKTKKRRTNKRKKYNPNKSASNKKNSRRSKNKNTNPRNSKEQGRSKNQKNK